MCLMCAPLYSKTNAEGRFGGVYELFLSHSLMYNLHVCLRDLSQLFRYPMMYGRLRPWQSRRFEGWRICPKRSACKLSEAFQVRERLQEIKMGMRESAVTV